MLSSGSTKWVWALIIITNFCQCVSHSERSKICLHGCLIGKHNLLSNYALRISFALETIPPGITPPPCTQAIFAFFKHALSWYQIVLLCCNTYPLIKLAVITLRETYNNHSGYYCRMNAGTSEHNTTRHFPRQKTDWGSLYKTRIAFAFITWLNQEQASRLRSSCRYPTPPLLPV